MVNLLVTTAGIQLDFQQTLRHLLGTYVTVLFYLRLET